MGTLRKFAETELAFIGYDENCEDMNLEMRNNVLELIDTFSKQGHSGFSANHCVDLFNSLARFEPLRPIMCTDDEWEDITDVSDTTLFQNNRHSAVFKEGKDSQPYFLDAIIWVEEGGVGFTGTVNGISSSQPIKIPFTPKSFRVKVDSNRNIINQETLIKALEYYDYHGKILIEIKNE